MKINILVTGPQYDSAAAFSAWRFCRVALKAGHQISQVFFYQQAVNQGNQLIAPLADEFNAPQRWQELWDDYQIPLIVCVSASERRGVLNAAQADELRKNSNNLHASFSVEGLGSFHAACLEADRTVTFK
jgi:tRNA 2-thiouridine synthesizing protein D